MFYYLFFDIFDIKRRLLGELIEVKFDKFYRIIDEVEFSDMILIKKGFNSLINYVINLSKSLKFL